MLDSQNTVGLDKKALDKLISTPNSSSSTNEKD